MKDRGHLVALDGVIHEVDEGGDLPRGWRPPGRIATLFPAWPRPWWQRVWRRNVGPEGWWGGAIDAIGDFHLTQRQFGDRAEAEAWLLSETPQPHRRQEAA